ncbi:hypothetical protein RGQ29_005916 [Quercus rubra]|uniref:Uncharacterized protein n=1 Tax=Quercus rubra TaxID=3512 RepID=A0AAN7E5G2_QUERU|nr:hypothetical protein RGQ29_005916 [Quercus rubra]
MKNVAEMRYLLRPKPFGRGHVCLVSGGAEVGLPCVPACTVSPKASPRRPAPRQSLVLMPPFLVLRAPSPERALRPSRVVASAALPTRPQVRRDCSLSLSISISGGKETYKDSPSNGERIGNSTA